MSNVFTRLFCPGSAAEEDYDTEMQKAREEVNEMVGDAGLGSEPPPLVAKSCAACKGVFELEGLTSIRQIIIGPDDVIRTEGTSYCQKCKPPTPFELVMEDDNGDYLDSMAFQLDHGWIQLVNDESGEERCIVSQEEYNHLFCESCGEESDWTTCTDCRAQADVKVPRKSGK